MARAVARTSGPHGAWWAVWLYHPGIGWEFMHYAPSQAFAADIAQALDRLGIYGPHGAPGGAWHRVYDFLPTSFGWFEPTRREWGWAAGYSRADTVREALLRSGRVERASITGPDAPRHA